MELSRKEPQAQSLYTSKSWSTAGVNNAFLVSTKADLATTYNDTSVLENRCVCGGQCVHSGGAGARGGVGVGGGDIPAAHQGCPLREDLCEQLLPMEVCHAPPPHTPHPTATYTSNARAAPLATPSPTGMSRRCTGCWQPNQMPTYSGNWTPGSGGRCGGC